MEASMRTQAWYEERKQGIGGSDAAVVLGISPWKTALQLWQEKRGELAADDLDSKEFVYWGSRLEAIIIEEYTVRTNRRVRKPDGISRHPVYPWMLCNLDGIVIDAEAPTILEAKNVGLFAYVNNEWGEPGSAEIPAYYYAQTQHNMEVTGAEWCDFPILIGGNEFRLYAVPRDKEFIDRMVEAERKFQDSLFDGTPPEPVNIEDLKLLYNKAVDEKIVEADEATAIAARECREGRRNAALIAAHAEQHEMKVRAFMGDASILEFNGVRLATWRNTKKGNRQFRLVDIDK